MHSTCAIIAKRSILEILAPRRAHARVCDLAQGFALVRLDPKLYEEISGDIHHRIVDGDAPFPAFDKTTRQELVELSCHGRIACVDTDYVGGEGSQSAISWEAGKPFLGPEPSSEPPISHVLRLMGVEKGRPLRRVRCARPGEVPVVSSLTGCCQRDSPR